MIIHEDFIHLPVNILVCAYDCSYAQIYVET